MAKSFELQIKEFENMTAEKSELLFKKVCFDLVIIKMYLIK